MELFRLPEIYFMLPNQAKYEHFEVLKITSSISKERTTELSTI